LSGSFKDIPGCIFSLKKDTLKRAFIVIGRENEFPVGSGEEIIKSARILLKNYLFPDEISGSDHDSGVFDELNDENKHDSDVESTKNGDLDELERKTGNIFSAPRGSPRKSVQISNLERVRNHDSARIQQLEALVQTLVKKNEESKQVDEAKLLNA
jgi:hypothetical protein